MNEMNRNDKKSIPIGFEDLKEIIDKNLYYVDKTGMIAEMLDNPAKVNLFTRPRRFGKTLNLSMIRRFFEKEMDYDGNPVDNGYLFKDLKISACGEKYLSHQGQYPVISLSLKSAKQPDYGMAYEALKNEIRNEFNRHYYILESTDLLESDKKTFRDILENRGESIHYATALEFLSACLEKYHHRKVIILIDEYDVPLENAYFAGFYEKMITFIRSLFESALKTNPHLEFAVITGCLRISRESIFTGLNNLNIYSIQEVRYAQYFGFTQQETDRILSYYGLEEKREEIQQWYDGYRFGKTEIYNPWSIVKYVNDILEDIEAFPKPYWSNTSSNSIIRELVEHADMATRQEIELLIAGGTIEKPVHEDITYGDIYESKDNLWNFLYFTGYLKKVGERMMEDSLHLEFAIPNREIRSIYRDTILSWFNKKLQKTDLSVLFSAIVNGDSAIMEEQIRTVLRGSISYYDEQEKFYHGFMLGLFSGMQDYQLKSNRESGDGRPDLILIPYDERKPAVIMEFKYAGKPGEMEKLCGDALQQISEKQYAQELVEEGYGQVLAYGICFCKKTCRVEGSGRSGGTEERH